MYQSDLKARTTAFAQTLLALYPRIAKLGRPYEHIAFQLFTAGSSVGAHLQEGEVFVSIRDKRHKHVIALREARESAYWLGLLVGDNKMLDELRPLFSEAFVPSNVSLTSVGPIRR